LPTSAATADQAAKLSAVYFCISLIAEAVGNCPLDITEDAASRSSDFELADVARLRAESDADGGGVLAVDAVPRGARRRAFAEPVVDGEAIYLWPLHPDQQSVQWRERGFTLHYALPERLNAQLQPEPSLLVLRPRRRADAAAHAVEDGEGRARLRARARDQGRKFFQEAKRLPGVVESDQKLDEDVFERLSSGINRWKTGKIPLLEQGLKFKPAGSNNQEAQFVELIDQRTHEMARYWRIPRSFYAADAGANAKSQEQEAQTFVKYTARPWTRRVEQAIAPGCSRRTSAAGYKVKFNLDGLLRGDSATQWKNAVLARTASVMSIDELRDRIGSTSRLRRGLVDGSADAAQQQPRRRHDHRRRDGAA
jgi:hypothetical protein